MKSLKKNFLRLNRILRDGWDRIAHDYYADTHRTSRNFDAVIDFYFPHYLDQLPRQGLFLDLGGGAGRLGKLMHSSQPRVIIGDISINMLKIGEEISRDAWRVQLSAFQLPFSNEVFEGVVSILGDSYALPAVFQEASRTLRPGGVFIIALPSKLWASSLRPRTGIPIDKTVFATRLHGAIEVPSFLYSESELKTHLLNAKFRDIETQTFSVRQVGKGLRLSQQILMPCNDLKVLPYDLPIVTIALACKDKNKAGLKRVQRGGVHVEGTT